MFEIFLAHYTPDWDLPVLASKDELLSSSGLEVFMSTFGGASFNGGAYRVIKHSDVDLWRTRVESAFPDFASRISCFGFDWLGRVFALDAQRFEQGSFGVVMFEPGTGEALEIPCNLVSFHNDELIEFREEALAISFFTQWIAAGGSRPPYDRCIGYKRPLFLGGNDIVDNLEESDLDVYWHLSSQLIRQSR